MVGGVERGGDISRPGCGDQVGETPRGLWLLLRLLLRLRVLLRRLLRTEDGGVPAPVVLVLSIAGDRAPERGGVQVSLMSTAVGSATFDRDGTVVEGDEVV